VSNSGSDADRPTIELRKALAVMDRVGALTTGALARGFDVSDRDVQILMITAEADRLVYSTTPGTWAITDRGRQTLTSLQESRRQER
jgi:hypothetical protein